MSLDEPCVIPPSMSIHRRRRRSDRRTREPILIDTEVDSLGRLLGSKTFSKLSATTGPDRTWLSRLRTAASVTLIDGLVGSPPPGWHAVYTILTAHQPVRTATRILPIDAIDAQLPARYLRLLRDPVFATHRTIGGYWPHFGDIDPYPVLEELPLRIIRFDDDLTATSSRPHREALFAVRQLWAGAATGIDLDAGECVAIANYCAIHPRTGLHGRLTRTLVCVPNPPLCALPALTSASVGAPSGQNS